MLVACTVVEVGWRHDIVRGLRPQNWLRDTNAEVVGLCEANGWGDRRVLQSLVHTSSRRGGEPSHSEMRSLNTNVNDPKGSSTRHVQSRSCMLDGRTDMAMLAAMASRAAKAGYPYATLFAVKSGYSIGEWPASIHPATPPTSAHACAHCCVWSCAVRVRVHSCSDARSASYQSRRAK